MQFKNSLVEYIKSIKHISFPNTNNKLLEFDDYSIYIEKILPKDYSF